MYRVKFLSFIATILGCAALLGARAGSPAADAPLRIAVRFGAELSKEPLDGRLLVRTMISKVDVSPFGGVEIVVLLEREPNSTRRYEYRLLATTGDRVGLTAARRTIQLSWISSLSNLA